MRRTIIVLIAAFAVLAAACGGDDTSTTTTAEAPPSDSATTTAPTTTTTGDTTTTTAAETTTTAAATTTTAATPTPEDAQAVVDAKTAAFAAEAPDGWTVEEQEDESFDEADFTYAPCLGVDDFDLDDLDPVTVAVKEVRATAPPSALPIGSTSAIVEARVFESEAVAADLFGVIDKIYGTDEGRQCMSDIVTAAIAQDAEGFEFEVTVEELEVEGAEVGTRVLMGAAVEGFDLVVTIDLVAHREGACTVVGTFIAFGEEFPADVADSMFSAAVGA